MPDSRHALADDTAAARIRRVSRRPAGLGEPQPGAVSLAMGEPDTDTPAHVVEAAVAALRAGRTHYAPMTGATSLREALAHDLSTAARPVDPDHVVLTHGGSAGLAAAIHAVVAPGDRVLVPEPTYSLYADQVAAAGGEVVWVANLPDGAPDVQRLGELAPTARLLVLCNPANPTGYVCSRRELQELAALAERHDALLLCDEAYRDIVYSPEGYCSSLELPHQDSVICCGTFSKGYAMTGWRLGWLVAPARIAARAALVHRTFNGPLNTFVQEAAVAALTRRGGGRRAMNDCYRARRDLVVAELKDLEGASLVLPQGAFYAFPRLALSNSSLDLTARLARAGVLVRAGSEFGPSGEGHIRISYATDAATITEGMRRLVGVIRTLSTSPHDAPARTPA